MKLIMLKNIYTVY